METKPFFRNSSTPSSTNLTSVLFKQKAFWSRTPSRPKSWCPPMCSWARRMSSLWGLSRTRQKCPTMMAIFQTRSRRRDWRKRRRCFRTRFRCSVRMAVFIRRTRRITTTIKFCRVRTTFWAKKWLSISRASFCSTSLWRSPQSIFLSLWRGSWGWSRSWLRIWRCLIIWISRSQYRRIKSRRGRRKSKSSLRNINSLFLIHWLGMCRFQ